MNFSKLSFAGFDLRIMGLFWALAFGVFAWQLYQAVKKEKQDPDFFEHHFWRWTVAGLCLGRLLALLMHPYVWEIYSWTSFFAVWEGGIEIYGFLFGFLGFMWWDMAKTDRSFLRYLDIGMGPFLRVAMGLDVAFFLTGSLYGRPTSLPWGVSYETFGVELITPLHPVTLYALILHIGLYFWLKRKRNSLKKYEGRFFITGMIGFIGIDMVLQFLRFDQTMYLWIFRIDQLFAAIMLGGLVYFYRRLS